MPIDRENGGTDRLLELFRDPPIVIWIERTNCNRSLEIRGRSHDNFIDGGMWCRSASPCTARNGEFILERAPADKSGRAIDAQQDERRLPDSAPCKRVRCLLPYVGISVL